MLKRAIIIIGGITIGLSSSSITAIMAGIVTTAGTTTTVGIGITTAGRISHTAEIITADRNGASRRRFLSSDVVSKRVAISSSRFPRFCVTFFSLGIKPG